MIFGVNPFYRMAAWNVCLYCYYYFKFDYALAIRDALPVYYMLPSPSFSIIRSYGDL